MKKSEWLDCQRNEFFPKQKGIPSLVKIEHKNTATLDSARSKKKSKVAVLQLSTGHDKLFPCPPVTCIDPSNVIFSSGLIDYLITILATLFFILVSTKL